MQTLRHFSTLTRLVLAWFVLSLGVAVASPLVNPQDTVLVCTGAGAMKVLVKADDGSTREVASTAMDCPLCAPVAPSPVVHQPVAAAVPLFSSGASTPPAHFAVHTAAPPPSRGPPSHS